MAVNKVEFGDQVVMDITDSTVSPEKLLSGETAYDRSGAKITGSLVTKDISIETKRSTGENVATISLDNTDYDIYALSEEEVADFLSGDQEAEGNPVTLKTLIGGNAKSCSVDLEPIQDLHGYDHPWPGGAGKNKIYIGESRTYESNGVTFTVNNDGTVTANGTASDGNAEMPLIVKAEDCPFNGYILNGCPSGGGGSTYQLRVTDVVTTSSTDTGSGIEINVNNTGRWRLLVRVLNGYTVNNLVFKPMIRLATETDPTFAPYENNCPISGRNSVELVRTRKNLCETVLNYALTMSGDSRVMLYNSAGTTVVAKCQAGVTYTVSGATGRNRGLVGYYDHIPTLNEVSVSDNTTELTNVTDNGYTFTATYTGYALLYLANSVLSNVNIQIELGSIATPYEPYQGVIVTKQLGQTVYGATLDVKNGKLLINKVILDMGSINWTMALLNRWQSDSISNIKNPPYPTNKPNIISEKYKALPMSELNADSVTIGIGVFGNRLYVRNGDTENEPTGNVCYELATPIEITLTAEQISLLKGINVLTTDGDNIDIKWQNIPDIEDITPIKPLDYSTSEQATGQKWIDGSDIYRRTFTGTIDSNTHGTTEIADFTNLQPIACNGWFMDTSGLGMALGYFPNSTSWSSALHIDPNHKLILFTESALASGTYYVTVDYIKTS